MEPPKKVPKTESLKECLFSISKEPGRGVDQVARTNDKAPIRRVETMVYHPTTNLIEPGESCYFITDGTIKFRHGGSDSETPPLFFLTDRTGEEYHQKVLVEFSASGSGKTVDLAGSSVSRGAHLAIVVSIKDSSANKVTDKAARNAASMNILTQKMSKVLDDTPQLQTLLDTAATSNDRLDIVVAIDEASLCPKLVRSIVAEIDAATKAVLAGLKTNETTVGVLFSVAGTGAASGSTGSNTKNFKTVVPSGQEMAVDLCDLFLEGIEVTFPGEERPIAVTYELIELKLPLVATLMENGRMASIAARVLKNHPKNLPIDEAKLVDTVVTGYLDSNGMQTLLGDPPRMRTVAACALAVHLFQWEKGKGGTLTPKEDELFQEFIASMECGISFSPLVVMEVTRGNGNVTQAIVSQFGLLEPSSYASELRPGEKATGMFAMSEAQQLVAVSMLGMKAEAFLEASPYGFEMLSTHVAKCAIAAATVVQGLVVKEKWDDKGEILPRPNLQMVLTKIGFGVDTNATSQTMVDTWNSLAELQIVEHAFAFKDEKKKRQKKQRDAPQKVAQSREDKKEEAANTKGMKVELDLVYKEYPAEKGKTTRKDWLQICTKAFSTLKVMVLGGEEPPALPSAWINYGASPLADGFVTFLCQKTDNTVVKFTLMNQAKDYHNGTRLDIKKLNDHAVRCGDMLLNGVFGSDRLLCVAGSDDVVFAKKKCAQKRDFIPYALDKGEVLRDLLQTLEDQRNVVTRIEKFATLCDEVGIAENESH